jgi:hypothetical protein
MRLLSTMHRTLSMMLLNLALLIALTKATPFPSVREQQVMNASSLNRQYQLVYLGEANPHLWMQLWQ